MIPDTPPTRRGVSVVVLDGDAVLLVRRGRAPAAGLWAPPGGRIEAGETSEAAARREVFEETGLEVRLIGRCARRDFVATDRDGTRVRWSLEVFAATPVTGTPRAGDDAAEARFVRHGDLDGYTLVEGARDAIAAARRLVDGTPPREAL
ncbi:MAG: NUDIX domain-containing protein [Phyllobacteriaceae bacterium]|nr:NUDIX domain-containing protein [Phyllobacteriaceae bacterium]